MNKYMKILLYVGLQKIELCFLSKKVHGSLLLTGHVDLLIQLVNNWSRILCTSFKFWTSGTSNKSSLTNGKIYYSRFFWVDELSYRQIS